MDTPVCEKQKTLDVLLLLQMGKLILIAALKETSFEVEPALSMLRTFDNEKTEQLKAIQKASGSFIHNDAFVLLLARQA